MTFYISKAAPQTMMNDADQPSQMLAAAFRRTKLKPISEISNQLRLLESTSRELDRLAEEHERSEIIERKAAPRSNKLSNRDDLFPGRVRLAEDSRWTKPVSPTAASF